LKLRFKNTIYRVRHAVGKQSIVLQDEYYRFNRGLDYEYDVEDFQQAIKQAERASHPKRRSTIIAQRSACIKDPIYQILKKPGTSLIVSACSRLYIEALLKVAELNFEGGQHQAALDFIHRALVADPCLEAAHRLAMRVHAAMGNRAAVARQYERCRQALLAEINALPSQQTQQLHESLMH
jgi:LuxR family transcriptional regulator, maltose regulon positive regulatory protein